MVKTTVILLSNLVTMVTLDTPTSTTTLLMTYYLRDGTRYHNTFKNIGSYKYCFNKLQCKMLPPIYKPPPGTFGDGAQQT